MNNNLEGCQYSICCNNDKYQELNEQIFQLQQEKEELVKDLKQFLNEWDEEDYVSKSIKLILSKLKESDI